MGRKPKENYLRFVTVRRLDVIHNIDMDVVQDYARLRHIGTFPQNASKDDTGFR
jgi:hypothetical protein